MTKKPSISVVIPAYNEEKYLPACLLSIRHQTFKDFELIVVDNNSTDSTAKIAKLYEAKVVPEKKQGMIPARERGFREAKAEIIARTDADTVVTPDWLKVIYETFTKHPEVVGMTGLWLSSSSKVPDKVIGTYSYFISVKMGKFLSGHTFLLGPNMAIRKSAWKKIKVTPDDRKVHEDIDLSCHLAKIGKIIFNKKMKVYFSFRRLETLSGIKRYLGEYPLRYLKTLYYNDVRLFNNLKRWNKIKLKLSKIWKSSQAASS